MKPRISPVIRAEQALLGAVLSDPAGQGDVLDLVRAEDMTRPYHGQVLAAMMRLRVHATAPGPQQVREEIAKDPDLPRSVSRDGALLIDLMQASPHSQHAPAYAAMVISSSIRRRVTLAASRISQAAGEEDPEVMRRLAAEAQRELDQCGARWQALPVQMRRELPLLDGDRGRYAGAALRVKGIHDEIRLLRQNVGTEAPHVVEERLAAIAQQVAEAAAVAAGHRVQQAQAHAPWEARPNDRASHIAGVRVLRDLVAAPDDLGTVAAWLQPTHFSHPGHGQLYAVMRDMHVADVPVDPITVTWEAARRGIQVDAAELVGGMGPFAVASAREVHRRGQLAHVARAGQDIQARASDPSCSVAMLMRAADDQLRQLELRSGPEHQQRSTGPRSAAHDPAPPAPCPAADAHEPAREAAQ